VSAKDLDPDRAFLQLVAAPIQLLLHDETQEAREALAVRKMGVSQQAI
jgi:hypothetical protein